MSNDFSGTPDLGLFSWDDLAPSLSSTPETGVEQGGDSIPTLDEAHYGVSVPSTSDADGWPQTAMVPSWEEPPAEDDEAAVVDYVPQEAHKQWEEQAAAVVWDSVAASASSPLPDPDSLLKGLNQQQHDAVVHEGEPLLIMAGAGSGKTRVLTHRIAYLLATGRARASEILAITFTNKAAAEMRERVEALVGRDARRMLVSTFHSACVRILRKEYRAAGLSSTFTIYDAQDSQRLIQMILKAHEVDVKRFTPKLVAARISDLKNELISPSEFADTHPNDPVSQVVSEAYTDYAKRLRQANAVDFDDLIMKTVQMLQEHPALAQQYHRRFRHILVDEYQDTNHAQYVLVRELVGSGDDGVPPGELTVVGDSDQSIYAFRGATIRNIEEFERDFPGARTIMLEQNYRSTQTILSAANAVISRNEGRRPKNLWTDSGEGSKIILDTAESDRDEARFVVAEIDRLGDAGIPWGDMAVFYRTNAQSRSIEELFVRQGIPYRVIGGTRFYERKEIKDALAYLQAIANPDDTVALRRILNTPRRGIGAKAEEALVAHADRFGISFGQALADVWQAAQKNDDDTPPERPAPMGLSPKARHAVAEFWGLLERLRQEEAQGLSVADILDELLDKTGYLAQLRASEDPQDASRVENLAELHSVAQDFVAGASGQTRQGDDEPLASGTISSQEDNLDGVETRVGNGDTTLMTDPAALLDKGEGKWRLVDFLERISLVADSDQLPSDRQDGGQVTMMTVHTAKGLEFPVVFVTGMEDGTFPHQRSLSEPAELAEERRLAYVAITRARERLYLTRAGMRSSWGSPQEMLPSRFLDDIPDELVDVRRAGSTTQAIRSGAYGSGYGGGFGASASYRRGPRGAEGYGGYGRSTWAEDSQVSPWDDDEDLPTIGSGRTSTSADGAGTKRTSKLGAKRLADIVAPKTAEPSSTTGAGASTPAADEAPMSLAVGDRVRHKTLGDGTVVGVEGAGQRLVAKIRFTAGEKRLLVRMAPMEKI